MLVVALCLVCFVTSRRNSPRSV